MERGGAAAAHVKVAAAPANAVAVAPAIAAVVPAPLVPPPAPAAIPVGQLLIAPGQWECPLCQGAFQSKPTNYQVVRHMSMIDNDCDVRLEGLVRSLNIKFVGKAKWCVQATVLKAILQPERTLAEHLLEWLASNPHSRIEQLQSAAGVAESAMAVHDMRSDEEKRAEDLARINEANVANRWAAEQEAAGFPIDEVAFENYINSL